MLSRGWHIESTCGIYFTKPIYWSLFYSRIREIIQDHERSRVFLTYVIFCLTLVRCIFGYTLTLCGFLITI